MQESQTLTVILIGMAGWLVYFFAWEFHFRGFLLGVLKRRFGILAIVIQTVPFVMMHFGKPSSESLAAVVAGIALGWWAYRSRSCGSARRRCNWPWRSGRSLPPPSERPSGAALPLPLPLGGAGFIRPSR